MSHPACKNGRVWAEQWTGEDWPYVALLVTCGRTLQVNSTDIQGVPFCPLFYRYVLISLILYIANQLIEI